MRKFLLLIVCAITINLFGFDAHETAKYESYKHDKGTLFAIKNEAKYHIFFHDNAGNVVPQGFAVFTGTPSTIYDLSPSVDDSKYKHMSETYFVILEGSEYSIYYKNYMGEISYLTKTSNLKKAGQATAPTIQVKETTKETKKTVKKKAETKKEEAKEDNGGEEEDDDDFPWFLVILIVSMLIGFFSGD